MPSTDLIRPKPASRAPLRLVDAYHIWSAEDGDAEIVGGPGFEALLLPGLTLQALAAALHWDQARRLQRRPDGLYLPLNQAGQPRAAAGRITTEGATLTFARIDAFRLT
jgi:hypothetical protein